MRKLKKIFSIFLTAAMALTLTSAVTASAKTSVVDYYTGSETIEVILEKNIIYKGQGTVIFEDGTGHSLWYENFEIDYVILHNDGIVTPEWFGLSDDYTLKQTSYDDTTETYTVTVETQEELDSLYEASKELMKKDIIENAYKKYTYSYGCISESGSATLTLKNENTNVDLNSIEGLDAFEVKKDENNPKNYAIYYSDLFEYIELLRAGKTIKENKNVEEFIIAQRSCAVAHCITENTDLLTEQAESEASEKTTQTSEAFNQITTEKPEEVTTTTTVNTYSSPDFTDGNNVIFDDGKDVIIFNDSVHLTHSRYDFKINYIIPHCNCIKTPEWFGLSDDYTIKQTAYDDTTETYTVTVETQEELDKLYEASKELLEKGLIKNAYKQFAYTYNSSDKGEGYIKLKQEDDDFELSFIKGLEDVTLHKYSSPEEFYTVSCTDLHQLAKLEAAEEAIKAHENVEEFTIGYQFCTVVLPPAVLKTYLVTEKIETPIPDKPIAEILFDANGDELMNIRDSAHIARMLSIGKSDELPETADYNKDGNVNVRDAAGIAQYLAALHDIQPV